jgi:hypothetical protein
MGVKCFFVTPIGVERVKLRRFVWSEHAKCSGSFGYHNALSDEVARVAAGVQAPGLELFPANDPRWPSLCSCGYQFDDKDERQVFPEQVYVRDGSVKEYFLRDNIPGMMYDAVWLHDHKEWCGPDGKSLHVVCPDGHTWCIDSRANNCTMPKDNEHKCWVRHGDPPLLTVDKRGVTCRAGAGSIQTPKYHGFLRGGMFDP